MTRIRLYEWLAGKLIVASVRLRVRRMAPEDAHELRHLWAAINGGNSHGCERGLHCTLDRLPYEYPTVWVNPLPSFGLQVAAKGGGLSPEARRAIEESS